MGNELDKSQSSYAFCGLSSTPAHIEAANFIVIPAPYEATTEWLPGTRQAPQAIIDSSRLLELYDHVLDCDISEAGIATAPELPANFGSPQAMVEDVHHCVLGWLKRGKTPVLLGGEHTITIGSVRAAAEIFTDLTVLHIDAHSDLRDEYLGSLYGQATVMRRVRELCPTVHAGIRALSASERRLIDQESIPVAFWPPPGGSDWVPPLLASLSPNVYITIDVDALDPGLIPWVGTPEPGGMFWDDLWRLLSPVATQRRVVALDVVEFAPRGPGSEASAYTIAKMVYRMIGAIYHSRIRREALANG